MEVEYRNGHYIALRCEQRNADGTVEMVRLGLRTIELDARRDWREVLRCKDELTGPTWEAVELYPAASRVVDCGNETHLWCFPHRPPFGFDFGRQIRDAGPMNPGQRPLRPGIDYPATAGVASIGVDS